MCEFVKELQAKIAANSGAINIIDEDERRAESKIRVAASKMGLNLWSWSTSSGLTLMSGSTDNYAEPTEQRQVANPQALLQKLMDWKGGPSAVIAHDFNSLLNRAPTAPMVARLVKDLSSKMKNEASDEGYVQLFVVDTESSQYNYGAQNASMPLPDRKELNTILDEILVSTDPEVKAQLDQDNNRERVLNAIAGLPAYQASNALAESIVRKGRFDADTIRRYKKELVSAKGLEWMEPDPRGLDSIGGMEPLKAWVQKRSVAFDEKLAKEYGIEPPRGLIIAGYPGTGKSQLAKGLAAEWGFSLIRFDVGQTRGMYQGQSEQGFREALKTAEAVSPCILFIDEAEKLFSGVGGTGQTDGGTSDRTFGDFLTWLQERTAPVFVFMTANRPQNLPDEFTRTGRLDARWWIDLPVECERAAIVEVFTKKYTKATDIDVQELVKASEGHTGAEIESAIKESLLDAMVERRDVTTQDVLNQLKQTNKVATTFEKNLDERLSAWRESAKLANSEDVSTDSTPNNKLAGRRLRRNV